MRLVTLAPALALAFALFAPLAYGEANCAVCHAGYVATLERTPHTILLAPEQKSTACVQCHGEARTHQSDPMSGGVFAFAKESATEQDAVCASCHSDAHASGRTAHARAGVACTDCHSVHGEPASPTLPAGFEDLEPESAICAGCHEDVLVQFAFNHRHRLARNSVMCTSCHDPHAEAMSGRIGDANSATCTSCHADKDGPFLFEHDASRVDGCLACHTPHGSANRHLLTHQQTGELCYGCHAQVPQFHLGFAPAGSPRFGVDSVCTNCHVTIHGSNLDEAFLK